MNKHCNVMPPKRSGFTRFYFATIYSYRGIKAAFSSEAAVRQEVVAMAVLLPIVFMLEVTNSERVLLLFSLFVVLITELLNTAVEKLSDHVSTDMHELIGKAKDIGSAAVFISLILVLVTWGIILL